MDITKLSLVELKAMHFDLSNDLQVIINEIRNRMQAPKEVVLEETPVAGGSPVEETVREPKEVEGEVVE